MSTPVDTVAGDFVPFALEEWQSRYEYEVRYNLADSGVHPATLDDLVQGADAVAALLARDLHYPPVGGTDRLRDLIAALQPGVERDHVLVTVGAAEANSISAQALVRPGDHVIVMEPGYRQLWGTCHNLGAEVDVFRLRPELGWRPDLDELRDQLRPDTRLVTLANPNNPVGTILRPDEMAAIVEACRSVGAWLLVDEVYRGSERLTEDETPSVWGSYDRLVVTGSLSKSYGLSGLRIGWLIAPPEIREAAWRRHEYVTISTSNLAMYLAELALAEPLRSRLVARTRGFIREGWAIMDDWLRSTDGLCSANAPDATALAFVRYRPALDAVTVAHRIREAGVLVAPGTAFGVDGHLRITHGLERSMLADALDIIGTAIGSLDAS